MKSCWYRKLICIGVLVLAIGPVLCYAQSRDNLGHDRAAALFETLKNPNHEVWEAYIHANYSQKFLEQYPIARHMEMLERLHKDFGNSKLVSIKETDNNAFMVIERIRDNHKVTFELRLDELDAHKINGVSLELGEL